jgi:NAD-dependent deacetylase
VHRRSADIDSSLHELAARIRGARQLTILTGAGVSAASGVPTFRGAQGLWRQYSAQALATPEAFARDPALVWEWYAWRRELISRCRPNSAHDVIAKWSGGVGGDCRVITQNVDDLHVVAGTRGLLRLHGSIWELACASGCAAGRVPWRDERVPLPEVPPRCPHCGALARPAVIWFGEPLDAAAIASAIAAAACDVFIAIGTSALVHPAAGLVHEAQRCGAFTAEINPEVTEASAHVDLAVKGPAETLLPVLDGLLAAA